MKTLAWLYIILCGCFVIYGTVDAITDMGWQYPAILCGSILMGGLLLVSIYTVRGKLW